MTDARTVTLATGIPAPPRPASPPVSAGRLEFRKVHGAGNDFVLVSGPLACTDLPGLARSLCSRRTGVGADGLVVSRKLDGLEASYEVRCLNADGSEATMCGNALRCAALCALADHGNASAELLMAGVWHNSEVRAGEVAVTAEAGPVAPSAVTVVHNDRSYAFDAVSTGTEHAVTFVADHEAVNVEVLGRLVRCHEGFAPVGTNVSFVRTVNRDVLSIRTYERGVEAETLSCGSGAVAAVVTARARGLVGDGPVTVHNRAGTPLTVRPAQAGGMFWVSGPAAVVFEGVLA